MLKTLLIAAAALVAASATPAAAATAVATTDVNLRAGPSTGYPVVDVVYAGGGVSLYGCLSDRAWCDVGYHGYRGWISSNYLASVHGGARYAGPQAVEVGRAPTVSFSVGGYWDRHYRDRSFYRERGRWARDRWDGGRRDRQEDRIERRRDREEGWDRPRDRDGEWNRPEYPALETDLRRPRRGGFDEPFEPIDRDY